MPRIPNNVLGCSVYMYATHEAAANGIEGASGFLVGVESGLKSAGPFAYGVTNTHVATRAPVMRLVDRSGKTVIRTLKATDWFHHDSADLAIALMPEHGGAGSMAAGEELFVSKATLDGAEIGLGFEAFMVGRLRHYDGGLTNKPTVRFGNLSAMPLEVKFENRPKQLAFLVEMRSISGYSGSPVFVYDVWAEKRKAWLLGIDSGHLRLRAPITDGRDASPDEGVARYVQENAGFAAVIPAWRIRELLYRADVVAQREARKQALLARGIT